MDYSVHSESPLRIYIAVYRSMGTCSISLHLYCTIPVNQVITLTRARSDTQCREVQWFNSCPLPLKPSAGNSGPASYANLH